MAAKKVTKRIKLQIIAAKATMAPPVGPALGQAGINGQQFCMQFNEATKESAGDIIPVEITIYEDRTFTFITKTPPAAYLLLKAAGIQSGAGNSKKTTVATISKEKLQEVAARKMPDLNAYTIEAAMKIIAGTAKNMGIAIAE